MKNALDSKTTFARNGQLTRWKWSIGPIVVWAIVAVVAVLLPRWKSRRVHRPAHNLAPYQMMG
jgi:hypothetical protein